MKILSLCPYFARGELTPSKSGRLEPIGVFQIVFVGF